MNTAMSDHASHAPDQHSYALPYHWCAPPFYRYVVERMIERVAPVLAGRRVLEAGCGDGFTTALIAKRASSVNAFDINERALAFARLIVEDPNVTFEVGRAGDVATIAERAGDVDVVAAFEMIEHLSDDERERFLAGCREVLQRRGGALVLSTPNAERSRHGWNPHHTREFGQQELRAILVDAGFEEPRISGVYVQPQWRRLEHFADTVPFRAVFRALARGGAGTPSRCRTLLSVARPRS
jgi:2-polyprenyl-3-methyl-5-hydroxy-6-metoxy-1,4-benzoquinol methylase